MDIDTTITDNTQKQLESESQEIQKEHGKKIDILKKQSIIYGGVGATLFLLIMAGYLIPQVFKLQSVRADISELSDSIETLAQDKKN